MLKIVLIAALVSSFGFLIYAVLDYLKHQKENAKRLQKFNEDQNTVQVSVEPSVALDTDINTAGLTLANGKIVTLSPIDLERFKRGVKARELNDEYMLRQL
jgi:hypothetical protein